MGHALAGRDLRLGHPDVLEQLGPVNQRLVFTGVYENGGAASMLGQNDGPFGPLHLPDNGGEIGAEIRQRADVLGWADARNGNGSGELYVGMYRYRSPVPS